MNYMSSNYKGATSMSSAGSTVEDGYYLGGQFSEALNEVFENISEQITTPDISLGAGSVIKDIVSDYFIPSGSTVTVKKQNYNGTSFSGAETVIGGVTTNVSGRTVTVTGYNFDANFISSTPRDGGYYGRKLIIEFKVTRAPGFIGGNDVPTNASGSGCMRTAVPARLWRTSHPPSPTYRYCTTASPRRIRIYSRVTMWR
jgi:hypothetical protein